MRSIYEISIALCFLCATITLKGQSYANPGERNDRVNITFNKNVEFLGYALHIADPETELSQAAKQHPLRIILEEKRKELNGHVSLLKAFELGAELSYSLFVELFARTDQLPHGQDYQIPEEILQTYKLNTNDDKMLVREIMVHMNRFYTESEFDAFWESSHPWYKEALAELTKTRPDPMVISTMEKFYEQKFQSYQIIPSLTIWSGAGFGFRTNTEEGNTAYFILGPLTDDYHFNSPDRLETLTVHEFGHSFVNYLLETTCSDLISDTEKLFDPVAERMRPQGYQEWTSCINEHFVRAGEILIPELMNNQTLSESNLKWNTEEKGFIYLPFIVDRLRSYRINERSSFEQSIRKTMLDLKKEFMP